MTATTRSRPSPPPSPPRRWATGSRFCPGVYTENVVLQPLVSLVSADVSSTDTTFVPGNALATVIRSPATTQGTANRRRLGDRLTAYTNPTTGFVFQTELAGLTIASSLVGDPALGPINTASVGLQIIDSTHPGRQGLLHRLGNGNPGDHHRRGNLRAQP